MKKEEKKKVNSKKPAIKKAEPKKEPGIDSRGKTKTKKVSSSKAAVKNPAVKEDPKLSNPAVKNPAVKEEPKLSNPAVKNPAVKKDPKLSNPVVKDLAVKGETKSLNDAVKEEPKNNQEIKETNSAKDKEIKNLDDTDHSLDRKTRKAATKAAKKAAKAEKARKNLEIRKAAIAENPNAYQIDEKDNKLTQIIKIIKPHDAYKAKVREEKREYKRALAKERAGYKLKTNWKHDHKKLWLDSMIGMTWGFIASLIVGTVIGLFGMYSSHNIFVSVKNVMSFLTPAAIGVGIAYKAKLTPLQTISIAIGVFIIAHSSIIPSCHDTNFQWLVSVPNFESTSALQTHFALGLPGDVFGAWIGSVLFVYLFKIFEWKTFIDLYLIPILVVFLGLVGSYSLTYLTSTVLVVVEWVINNTVMTSWWLAILLAPIIGITMGFALSLPTSSAAIAFALSLNGHAAVAAIAGTAGQMISFGVITYLATGSVSKSISVGFGTSMLQMSNFVKHPRILLIPGIVSGLTALLAVLMFKDLAFPLHWVDTPNGPVQVGTVTSGMGTAMLYGQIFTLKENGWGNYLGYLNVIFVQLLIPALLGWGMGAIAFKKGFLKKEWLEIKHA